MLTGPQLLSVMQPWDSVTLSYLATMLPRYKKISTILQAWNCSCKCYWHDIAFNKAKEET